MQKIAKSLYEPSIVEIGVRHCLKNRFELGHPNQVPTPTVIVPIELCPKIYTCFSSEIRQIVNLVWAHG
jgi:hypothetical protein